MSNPVQLIWGEVTLMLRNIRSRRGNFIAEKQQYFILPDILPKTDFKQIRDLVLNNTSLFL